jgi:alkylation response protein AidB-like acyl-CoA dehydrogenase
MIDLDYFRHEVQTWLDSVEIPRIADNLDQRFTELRAWQHKLYDAGYVGLTWPAQWGGQGLSHRHQQVLGEELAAARAPQPIGLIGIDVVGPSIGTFGTPQQRAALLPSLLSGEQIWCQGFSEPGAGSDLAAITTRAVRDGDEFVVNGQKVWTSWAHAADWCALLVRTHQDTVRHRGLSYLLVDMQSNGISVRPLRQMTGESEFGEVFFDQVRVPVANLIGEVGQGWAIAMDTLSHERSTFGLRRYLEISVPFWDVIDKLRTERAILSDRQLTTLGHARVAQEVLHAQVDATLERVADQAGPSPLDSVDKLVLSWAEQEIFGSLRKLIGPLLNDRESKPWSLDAGAIGRDYLYGRAASIYGGSSEIPDLLTWARGE